MLIILKNSFVKYRAHLFTFLLMLFLTACSNTSHQSAQVLTTSSSAQQSISQRNQQMLKLNHWRIQGKIAFIANKKTAKSKKKSRQSANLTWLYNKNYVVKSFNQKIDLTTFLGINVLHVESQNNQHRIKVDGKTYTGDNLSEMIFRLTGLNLPAKALTYWLKGLSYNHSDQIIYDDNTHLPKRLYGTFSTINQGVLAPTTWEVRYQQYRRFSEHQLATKLTILHQNLTIKIAINQWSIL